MNSNLNNMADRTKAAKRAELKRYLVDVMAMRDTHKDRGNITPRPILFDAP